jgi:pimeloyl-ACP methyl ester carboxylesterase
MLQKKGACREEFVRTSWGVITRHYVDVNGRRVHYRKAGSGPPLLMVHQSPRSSAEYESLMRDWSRHFTCIAPDTPGFGQSEPLPGQPEIGEFADALIQLLDVLGVEHVGGYGFHSGGIILVSALRRHPDRFTALAIGGYAIWTEDEQRIFGEEYLPPFQPKAYGEHLTWLWNRILEQSWFFPWFDTSDEARLSGAHGDLGRVDAVVREMLDSGDAYRAGYGAVLRAPRDLPVAGEPTRPVLISAYVGDPLQAHLDRLGPLPELWRAISVADPAAHRALSLEHLLAYPASPAPSLHQSIRAGFLQVRTTRFDGLIHWHGEPSANALLIHGPGRSLEMLQEGEGFAIDLPGHGLSDNWIDAPPLHWGPWDEVIRAVEAHFGTEQTVHEPLPAGAPELLFPDLSPQRCGEHLIRAWAIARARHIFSPWYAAGAANAIPLELGALAPERLALECRALLRARAGRELLIARREAEGGQDGHQAGDAAARAA